MTSQIPVLRLRLRDDIEGNRDPKISLSNLIEARCPYGLKYKVIQVDRVISENGQSPHSLKMIPVAVNILEKYGKHLLKSSEVRANSWRSVKFTNRIFKDRVDILKGGRDIMKRLGYTVVEDDGMAYPPDTEPDREQILDVLADLLLLKKEIEAFFGSVHPDSAWIESLVSYKPESISSTKPKQEVIKPTEVLQKKVATANQSAERDRRESSEKQSHESSTSDVSAADGSRNDVICDICGDQMAMYTCTICDNKLLCNGCDTKWHKHPKRQNHQRVSVGGGSSAPPQTSPTTNNTIQTQSDLSFSHQHQQQERTLKQMSPLQPEIQTGGMQIPVDTSPLHHPGEFIPSPYPIKTGQQMQHTLERNVQHNLSPLQMQERFRYHHPNPVYPPQLQQLPPGQPMYQTPYMFPKQYDAQNKQSISYQNVANRQVNPRDLLPPLIPDSNISEVAGSRMNSEQVYNHPNTTFSENIAYPPQTMQTNVPPSIHSYHGLNVGRYQNTEALMAYRDTQTSNTRSPPSHHEIEKRKSKLELKISTLEEEIDELDEKITTIIHTNEEFFSDPDYVVLNRRKGKYMREKREFEMELQQLNMLKPEDDRFMKRQNAAKLSYQKPVSDTVGQVFYPPSLSTLFPSGQSVTLGMDHCNTNLPFYSPGINQQYLEHGGQQNPEINRGNYNYFVPTKQTSPVDVTKPQNLRTLQNEVTKIKDQHIPEPKTQPAPFTLQPVNHQRSQVANTSKIIGPIEMYSQSEVITNQPDISEIQEARDFNMINEADRQNHSSKPEDKKMEFGDEKLLLNSNHSIEDTGCDFLIVGPPSAPPMDPSSLNDRLLSDHNTQQWQCEHCTYINEPGPCICVMCNKTSDNPAVFDVAQLEESRQFPPTDHQEQLELFEQKIAADQERVYQEKQEAQRSFEEEQKKNFPQKNTDRMLESQTVVESVQQRMPDFLRQEARDTSSQLNKTKMEENKMNTSSEIRELSPLSSNNSASSSMFNSGLSAPTSGDVVFQKLDLGKALEDINEKRRIEKMCIDGRDTINMLKNADNDDIDIDDMAIAVRNGDMEKIDPLTWFKEKWVNMLESLVTRVNLAGRDADENEIGEITIEEARRALRASNGNVNEAVIECVQKRRQLFAFLHASGPFAREDILEMMNKCKGDEEEALTQLQMKYLLQFYERMWENHSHEVAPNLLYHPMAPDHCLSVSNSVVSHASFQAIVKNKNTPLERRIRMVMIEGKLQSWGRGETVIRLLDCDVGVEAGQVDCSLEDIVEAVRNCGDRDSSLIYLKQECQCCFCDYPMSKIRNFSTCQCQICSDCVKQNFEVAIKDKHIRNWTCPICSLPNVEDVDVAETYFSFLSLMLQTMLDPEMLELYQTKLRDWHLQRDPNFRWCSHCGNGFLYNGTHLKMTCSQCHLHTCFQCKNMWEDQHENLTCEQFEQWKIDNDPDNQAVGLARHLEINGIDCPSCKMKYSLAKGGCMHFKCPQCGHEFCSGCSFPFFQKGMCTQYVACRSKGLHCHHPRDCFFYLRDNDVKDLQKLLQDYNVQFDKDPPQSQEDKLHCPVMEQKEYDMGKKDESCGQDVEDGHAGVCVNHYKEYLVTLINKNKVDPVSIMSLEDMRILIQRKKKKVPTATLR